MSEYIQALAEDGGRLIKIYAHVNNPISSFISAIIILSQIRIAIPKQRQRQDCSYKQVEKHEKLLKEQTNKRRAHDKIV